MPQTKMSQKNQIVIPKEAREEMHVKGGDHLIVEALHGVTILIPKPKKISRSLRGLSKGVYPPNYLTHERKSWSQ